ncbi:MAG: hypothetical protein L3J52_00355 [Proteobacteria bacterium]|nr:hypothetical protein [Pseudomonadota bacterium]
MNIKKSPTHLKRTFVTVLMLLFFIGQTLALNDVSVMGNSDRSVDVVMLDSDHDMAGHEMSSETMHLDQGGCCGEDCPCSQGVSSEISIILNKQSKVERLASLSRLKSAYNFILNNFPNRLYRPPMTC